MYTELSERIKKSKHKFSRGQRLIASYIEEHYDKVALMTASKLGSTVGVSESTVVRFATEIGYSGYPALQQAMEEMTRNRLTSVQRLEITADTFSPEKLLDASIEQDIDILKRTKEHISHQEFYDAVDDISDCTTVYVVAAGSSVALATFLTHYLELLFDNVVFLDGTSEAKLFQQLMRMKKGDGIIAISFPRYSKKVVKALKYAVEKGVISIAITDTAVSPLAKTAQHVLFAKSDMASFVDSLVAPLSLINAFLVTVAIKKKDIVVKNLKNLEDIWDEYGIYEKVDE